VCRCGRAGIRMGRSRAGGIRGMWAGKNCRFSWTGQVFDEPAYARFLNPYLYTGRIPKPPGYLSTGSGSTWSFFHGRRLRSSGRWRSRCSGRRGTQCRGSRA
jgi:hypothetical protein